MAEHTSRTRYGTLDRDYIAAMAAVTPDQDGPFYMLNLMRYREWADYGDDRPRITGREADDLYAPLEVLHDLGAEVVLFGDVTDQPRGAEGWERVAIVRYPTVRSFIEMQERPDFIAQHVHKDAGMDLTILALCHPVAGAAGPGRRVVVDLVEGVAAGDVAPRPGQLVLSVDGSPVGDGRSWSTLVITSLPDGDAADIDVAEVLVDAPQSTTVSVMTYLKDLP